VRVSWASELVDTMCDLKRAGYDFNTAWAMAIQQHPARGPKLHDIPTENLFEAAREGDGPVQFMHRACFDAWHGLRPALGNLRILSEGDAPGHTPFRFAPRA
jgi:hypothetical protein